MKISLNLSVLKINVTLLTETSLRPIRTSVESQKNKPVKVAEVSTDKYSALGTKTFEHLPRYLTGN